LGEEFYVPLPHLFFENGGGGWGLFLILLHCQEEALSLQLVLFYIGTLNGWGGE
jgi:hypothetical protein